MFNKREKEFNELMGQVDVWAGTVRAYDPANIEALGEDSKFAARLGAILAAPDLNAWIDAVRIALEALAAKLYGNGDRPKWTKIASAAVQIAAFVVTMIRSLKQLKK